MAGGIAFAAAGDFQAYSKQWRLFADVTNDLGGAPPLGFLDAGLQGAFGLKANGGGPQCFGFEGMGGGGWAEGSAALDVKG
jgi:hypothetical protein